MALNNDSEIKVYVTREGREVLLSLVTRELQTLIKEREHGTGSRSYQECHLTVIKRELEQAGS